MNNTATSAPGASLIPAGTGLITATHLVIIAVFSLLVLIGIVWGSRLKRRRRHADREIAADNAAFDTPTDTPRTPALSPVAPPPPPASDEFAPSTLQRETWAAASAPSSATNTDQPVTLLKGLGPKVAARLGELGITTIGQLAALDEAAAADLDAQLGTFAGRMGRDRWREQARLLAAGDKPGFEARFGKL